MTVRELIEKLQELENQNPANSHKEIFYRLNENYSAYMDYIISNLECEGCEVFLFESA